MVAEKLRKTFLSYSRINKDFAVRLARELKSEGFNVWLDQLDIPAGARWDREVERALRESEIFMIILTSASVDSENVLDEIGFAIDTSKRILPVLLEKCDVPFRLRRFQYVDFTNKGFDDGVESAKELLRGLIEQPTISRVETPGVHADLESKAEAERKAREEAEPPAAQKAEAARLAAQKAEEEQLAKAKADAERLASQKAEEERLAAQKAEEDWIAKEEADRLAVQKAEKERKAEEQRLAKVKAEAESKAKEKLDSIEKQPVEMKAKTVTATHQKKTASKGMTIGITVVVVMIILGIGLSVALKSVNKNSPGTTGPIKLSNLSASEASNRYSSSKYFSDIAKEKYGDQYDSLVKQGTPMEIVNPTRQPLALLSGWCSTTQTILDQNLKYLQVSFEFNGQKVSEDKIAHFDSTSSDGWACRSYFIVVDHWSSGKYSVRKTLSASRAINDGQNDYAAGTLGEITFVVSIP